MERVQAEEVIKAVAEICRQHSVRQLVLFGSRAKGTARERDLKDSFVLSGTGAKFSITFDLAWKVMKDVLVQHYAIVGFVSGSPREVLRQAYKAELITGDVWMEMLQVRNQLTHDYDSEIVKHYCKKIVDVYIDKFYELKAAVEGLEL